MATAQRTDVYRFHTVTGKMVAVREIVKKINSMSHLNIKVERDGHSWVFYTDDEIREPDMTYVEKVIGNLIHLCGVN